MIHFYEKRFIYFAISGLLFLTGLIFLITNGAQLDIQFKGGAILKYQYVNKIDPDAIADLAQKKLNRLVDVQITTDLASKENRMVLNLAGDIGLDAKEQDVLDETLKKQYPDAKFTLSESSMVEPFFGHKFFQNGMIAIALAAIMIVIYVWARFRKISGLSAGVMALVALFHDVLMVFFCYVIFRIPIGDAFVAVVLTIIGYSINDTIVIYDRIRENARIESRLPVDQLVNKSITQSLSRSIITNVAVLISVSTIYFFAVGGGIDSIQRFALPMMFGSISGCYSTVCIAGPLWVMWQKHKKATA